MDIFSWLKIGIMVLVSLTVEEIEVNETSVSALVRAETLLTQEMKDLIEHGVTIEFELYNSLLLKGKEERFFKKRIYRSISYDYYREVYALRSVDDAGVIEVREFSRYRELDMAVADFGQIVFTYSNDEFDSLSWFSQISLVANKIIEEELGQNTESLWDNHRPSVTEERKR
ncbi:MAG: hypothetical protein JEY91_14465 [Spirochaetaceae bacterium]|nr:hypothetical protein [Spirochaetaceae bacterium]